MRHRLTPDPTFLAFQAAVAGRYSIDREVGRGGMGIVYLAREVHLDRPVAIKLLPPVRAADPDFRSRFLREARLAAKLSHPHIIPIHAVAESGEFVYYVMAFVDGETLASRVRTRGPMSVSDGVRALREVAWALGHAHAQGLVHRDVKPDNILLESATGRALVTDFGIAAAAGDAATDGAAGTPEFMSPEQASSGPVDARSDLYSLGATAFFTFSGRIPFEGRTTTEILARHVTEPAPPLASVGVTVPRKVAALVDRCLAKDPAQRPASADAIAEQLGLALDQRRELPVALRAFVKRNSRMDGGGTLLAGFGLLAGAISLAPIYGGKVAFGALIAGATLGKLGFMVAAARRLLRQGFSHADVGPAFQREREQIGEELAVDRRSSPAPIERALKYAGIAGVSVGGLGVSGLIGISVLNLGWEASRDALNVLVPMFAYGGGFGFLSTLAWMALVQRRTDIDTGFWHRVWTGPLGRVAFSAARRLGGSHASVTAITHRATELSLGLAAEQLFETLPKAMRQSLAELPAVLDRLQTDARTLRARYESLQEALAEGGAVADSPEFADLRGMRDEVQARLGETVGSLESLRLGLLRLHAGSATIEGFTTHLGVASAVSTQVERLIRAQDDVDRELRFPAAPVTTPA